jgi:glycosyltransferase involved in cell wall biosynthesis
MKALKAEIAAVSPADLEARRAALGLTGRYVGIYVGGIYAQKRIDFLVEASRRIRAAVPDFELLVVGGGPDTPLVEAAAKTDPFIRFLGPRYGAEKTELAMLADVFLMPGLVGLAVLDSFGYGTPMVTTDYPFHSPEIDYLKDGVNGRIARPWQDVQAYADAVIELFQKPELRERLAANARAEAAQYSIEAMASRFADGVVRALETA